MFADEYDRYDPKTPLKKNKLFNFFKLKKKEDPNRIIFHWAGVAWMGSITKTVDPNPLCITCETQLSFTDKDVIICDMCHKHKTQVGEFHFMLDNKPVSYDDAYESAQARWLELLQKSPDYIE